MDDLFDRFGPVPILAALADRTFAEAAIAHGEGRGNAGWRYQNLAEEMEAVADDYPEHEGPED